MAPVLASGRRPAGSRPEGGVVVPPQAIVKKRTGSKWLESIKAELDEYKILTEDAKPSSPAAVRGAPGARAAKSPPASPAADRRSAKSSSPAPRAVSAARAESPARAEPPSRRQPPSAGAEMTAVAGRGDAEAASREVVLADEDVRSSLPRRLRGQPMRPCGRYPRSLSPSWGPQPSWPGSIDSAMRWRGAEWSGLTEPQRPPPSPELRSRSVVPFYDPDQAFKKSRERSMSSVWSREISERSKPEQWGDRSNYSGMPRRVDGHRNRPSVRRSHNSERSASRSQSRGRSEPPEESQTGARQPAAARSSSQDARSLEPVRKAPPPLAVGAQTKVGTLPIKLGTNALDEWYKHKERELFGVGNDFGVNKHDVAVVSVDKTWQKGSLGRFNESPRETSDWIYRGIDKQMALEVESTARLSARRSKSNSPRPVSPTATQASDLAGAAGLPAAAGRSPRPTSRPSPASPATPAAVANAVAAGGAERSLSEAKRLIADAGRSVGATREPQFTGRSKASASPSLDSPTRGNRSPLVTNRRT